MTMTGEGDRLGGQLDRVRDAFRERTGRDPEGVWAAPGRVNLIGDHTDHNDGFVLPLAIDLHVVAAIARRRDDQVRAWSLQEAADQSFVLGSIRRGVPRGWVGYVAGVAWALAREGIAVGGFDVVLDGTVPPGAGLASSAAVECATALGLADLSGSPPARQTLALAARRGEVEIVGVPCGVMDQLAAMCCREGSAMLLDTRSLEREHIPLALDDLHLVVIEVGAPHRLVDGGYARRRAECEAAARALGLDALRDAAPSDVDRLVDETILRRARHVVTENQRVLDVASLLRRGNASQIGPLLTASHRSLRDDFEVSTPELDAVVEACLGGGALGARITGAGFGGCAIALVPHGALPEVRRRLSEGSTGGASPRMFTVEPTQGAHRVA